VKINVRIIKLVLRLNESTNRDVLVKAGIAKSLLEIETKRELASFKNQSSYPGIKAASFH
jgi:hypothetical protein